jgi:hypothetical protein
MKQGSFRIRSLMIAIASYGIALTVIRWCGVRSPQHAMLFSLGPLCGVYLHKHRGGNGIVGGAIGGIAVAFVFVVGDYFGRVLSGGSVAGMNYGGLLSVLALLECFGGAFLGVVCRLGDRAFVALSVRK